MLTINDPLKPRDKITQKMSRDGAIEVNETKDTAERISKRDLDADFAKPTEQTTQEAAAQLDPTANKAPPLPFAPKQDTGLVERIISRTDSELTRKASKKAVKKAHDEATAKTKSSRLQFTDEERATPELEKYIKKSDKAADKLDKARAKIPKKKVLTKERVFDDSTGKAKTRIFFEEKEKPIGGKNALNPLSRPAQEAGLLIHSKIHSVEKENAGVEGAHKTEKAAERVGGYGVRKIKQSYRSQKLKPCRAAAKAEKVATKANVNFQYQKSLRQNPRLASNPLSRYMQKRNIKKQYAKTAKSTATTAAKTAKRTATETKRAVLFVARHPTGVIIAIAALLLFIIIFAGLSSFTSMFSGSLNSIVGTSYVSTDSAMLEAEADYAGLEQELQQQIDNIESTHSGYDEYRYDLDVISHDPYVLTSILTALHMEYTRSEAQSTLAMLFEKQYSLTLTEEVEVRYRTETRTRTTTDSEGNISTETYTVEVPYNYYILNVALDNFDLSRLPVYIMSEDELSMYAAYMATLGNRPDLFPNGAYPNASTLKEPVYYDIPPEALEDETFAAIIGEAEKYLGYPYVWGGSNPSTSFDCSGYVSWVINHSGWNVGRLGAQGLYNISTPVTGAQAKPGDLIFFKGTYDTSGVSHVGIYVGDGVMIHCGDPISYTSVNTNYWQNHFYAYGRLP